jgi:hypothetical protein
MRRMHRFVLLVAAAAAAIIVVPTAGARVSGAVTPTTIEDSFSGKSIDSSVWSWWGTNDPQSVTFGLDHGAMKVDVAADASPDFSAGGQTRCAVRGDFDARARFELTVWPPHVGVWISLFAAGTPYNVYRVGWQFSPGDAYGAYLPPAGSSLPAADQGGTLRLTRWGDIYTGWYLSGVRWIPIISGIGRTDDEPLSLSVYNISNASPFGGQPVEVKLTRFHVEADGISCP